MESSKETTSMDTETTKSFLSSATTTTLSHKMIVDQAEMSAISMTQQHQLQQVLKNSKDISISLKGSVEDNKSTVAAISDDVLKSDMSLIQKMTDMNMKETEIMNIDDSIEDISEQKKSQLSEENKSSLIPTSMKSSVLAMSDQSATIYSTDPPQTKEITSQDGPSQIQTKSTEPQQEIISQQPKKNNIDATIKEIISDIDSNIRDQEHIANLKQQEQELLRKQQQLAQQIQQQQLLAQKLADENIRLQQQQLLRTQQQQQQLQIPQNLYQTADAPNQNVSKYSTYEKIEDENGFKSETTESYETSESTNTSKKVDLYKIFTPAADADEILPRNRKLYASSAFYSPTLHPTVEDQVELARRISHSLSDKSNQKSKGQSMYVNRKKRSVKWVHEGQSQDQAGWDEHQEEFKENRSSINGLQNDYTSTIDDKDKNNICSSVDYKIPLRLLMNPFGQMRDYNSLRESINIETGLLSPDKCAELVAALKTQKSRGAELFAKRRKKSDKWIVDECSNVVNSTSAITPTTFTYTPSNTTNNSTGIESLYCGNLTDFHQYQPKPPTSPSIVPAYSDAGKHRVQLNMHQEQVLEKYAKPSLKVLKTPWEAALETGSASAAFIERVETPSGVPQFQAAPLTVSPYRPSSNADFSSTDYEPQQHVFPVTSTVPKSSHINHQRDLAYKPNLAQGWKAPGVTLPKELYVPKEIPLDSYAPPPIVDFRNSSNRSSGVVNPSNWPSTQFNQCDQYNKFPVNKQDNEQTGFSSTTSNVTAPMKENYLASDSFQTVPQKSSQNATTVNFNPSPLSYDKLAKFENPEPPSHQYGSGTYYSPPSSRQLLYPPTNGKFPNRNVSPIPFRSTGTRSGYLPASTSVSPRPLSAEHYYGYNSPLPNSTCNVTARNLLNAPNYNKAARGWNIGPIQTQPNYSIQTLLNKPKPMPVTGNMQYTDF